MNLWKMGWRNVWRNKRRTLVTIAAMTLALWVLLLYAGLIPGYLREMEEGVTDLEVGDVQIHAPGYLEAPSLYTTIDDADALLAALDREGLAAAPRLLGGGLAASGEFSAGVSLRGIDVSRNAQVSGLPNRVAEGSWLDPADPDGVVLGRRLARTLGAGPGSELVVVSQAADGSMANDLYEVRGVLHAVAQGTDRAAVFLPLDTFRELMVLPEGVHEVVVRRGDRELPSVAATVERIAHELDVQLDVKTWKELMPTVAQMLESTEGLVYIFYFIVYIAVGILILNAMLTAVFERIREFGVLKAIGAGPLRVLGLILVEGAIQAAVAMAVGIVLALPAMFYLQSHGINVGAMGGIDAAGIAMAEVWYGIYTPATCTGPIVLLWFISMAAVLYPALKAAWINPIHAIRHQ